MIRRNRVYISRPVGGILAGWFFISGGAELLKMGGDESGAGIGLISLGIIAIVATFVSTANAIHRAKRISHLIKHGQPRHGKVSHFYRTPVTDTIRPGYTYRVIVEMQDKKGESFSYSSDPVAWPRDLGFLLHHQVPVPATVFVNPENKKEYYVDIDALNATIEERIRNFRAK